MFGILKKIAKGVARDVSQDLGKNKDFLEAVCAAGALIAAADGDIEQSETDALPKLVANDATLGKLYNQAQIEECMQLMLRRATSTSGKLQLQREILDLKSKPDFALMAETVVAVSIDISLADGEIEEAEKKVLQKIATWLSVDIKKFDIEGLA